MLAKFVERTDVDIVMVAGRFTLLDQSALASLLPLAQNRGVAVVAAAVYNSGLLSTSTIDNAAHYDYGKATTEIIDRARQLAEVCTRHGVDLPAAPSNTPCVTQP